MTKFIINNIKFMLIASLVLFFSKNILAEDFGNKEEALALLKRAVALVEVDKNRALDLFATGNGGLHQKDLYPFCLTTYNRAKKSEFLPEVLGENICTRYVVNK